jgi:hypothetical protein
MSALGPRAALLAQFSATAATKGKVDASRLGFSTRWPERLLAPAAVIQISLYVLNQTAANGSEATVTTNTD